MHNLLNPIARAISARRPAVQFAPFSSGNSGSFFLSSKPRDLAKPHSNGQHGSQSAGGSAASDLQQRLRRKTRGEVISSGARIGLPAAFLEQQLDVFESLLPRLHVNLDQMRASDWARVVADPDLGSKLVLIKVAFPALNVEVFLSKHPRTLLWSREKLESNMSQVTPVLHSLPRPELVLEVLPELLDPRQCFSVVATLRKWYPKRDPLQVLQMDPDVIRRAEAWDVPLEPVFFDSSTGTWTAAGYSRNKQEDWQVYIEQEIYKRKPQPIDKQDAVIVGGRASSAASEVGTIAPLPSASGIPVPYGTEGPSATSVAAAAGGDGARIDPATVAAVMAVTTAEAVAAASTVTAAPRSPPPPSPAAAAATAPAADVPH